MFERNWKKMSIAKRGTGLWYSNFLFAGILLICGIIPFVSISLASGFPLSWQLKHEAFHAVMETLGCMLALGIAGFLLMRQGEKGNEYKLWLACSMLSMAILDAFHASVAPSREFICLHTTAQFPNPLITRAWELGGTGLEPVTSCVSSSVSENIML